MQQWRLTKLKGEFCVTWDEPDGVRRRYRLGTSDFTEANAIASARYAELRRTTSTTVSDLWSSYMIDMAGRAVVETMTHTWKALKDRFGQLQAEEITIAQCRAHTAARSADGIADGTIHTELGHLRMVLLWAEKHQLITKAPAIERPPKPESETEHLTREEAKALVDAAKVPHVRLVILLLLGTGARIEAALQLTWDRVDLERGMIQLRNPFDKKRRKGRATVPMNDRLRAALAVARKGALSPYVIEWAGKPVKSIKRGLKAAGAAMGRPDVHPHMLRHSAAVWLAEAGHSMDEIAQFLGHKDAKITARIYARFSPTHLRKLANDLEF